MEFSLTEFLPVTDRVYRAVAQPHGVTIGLVVGDAAALVVDTGNSVAQGRAIREAARHVAAGVPLAHVVVTHAHSDHLLGLGAFTDLTTWGARGLPEAWAAAPPSADELAAGRVDLAAVVFPTQTFSLAATINLGGVHAELVNFGPGHTAADAVVILPEVGVVFAGDLLESAAFPAIGPDSALADWPRTLDGTLGTLRSHSTIVPGHGPVMDQAGAFIQRGELAWLSGQLDLLWDNGTALADIWDSTDQWPCTRAEAEAAAAIRFTQFEAENRPRRRTLPLLGR
ncbi:MAG: MBL fold metallo-hydrolase [Propioniciclava sp.]